MDCGVVSCVSQGSVLVFLPGVGEIMTLVNDLRSSDCGSLLQVLPLHGSLSGGWVILHLSHLLLLLVGHRSVDSSSSSPLTAATWFGGRRYQFVRGCVYFSIGSGEEQAAVFRLAPRGKKKVRRRGIGGGSDGNGHGVALLWWRLCAMGSSGGGGG